MRAEKEEVVHRGRTNVVLYAARRRAVALRLDAVKQMLGARSGETKVGR